MKIPKHFELMGHTISVDIVPAKDWKFPDHVGEFDSLTNKMLILKASKSQMEHTFAHELTHCILGAMGHKLNKDEKFVDVFGGLLAQVLKTKK